MRVEQIIAEFLDYRAYVSHTLVKHRLFLGLHDAELARSRLQDASVWPLVVDEADRLVSLQDTLFGLESRDLNTARDEVRSSCVQMRRNVPLLFAGSDAALGDFRASACSLSDALSSVSRTMNREIPTFSKVAVDSYLAGRSCAEYLRQHSRLMRDLQERILAPLLSGGETPPAIYREFWTDASEAYLCTRCATVAGAAAGGVDGASRNGIREAQRILRKIERIVACWSPGVPASERNTFLDDALCAAGFPSAEALLVHLTTLGG